MFGPYKNTTEDSEKYQKVYLPKVEAYRKKLDDAILDEYKLADDLIPTSTGIDVTKIPDGSMTKEELEIINLTGCKLAEKIASGEYTSVTVFKAYAKRATMAHQLTNCAMELFTDEGLKRAEELDEYFKKNGKTVGFLHGLPVSLKEHYDYKGRITHAGYVAYIDRVSEEWCLTSKCLYDQGAVFYIRTTEPQCLMHLCSNNNITGKCLNPTNTSLTPGGSSSGEGALAAMKGSVFGLGSDIGGSIRCPAAFNGVWGLRPTQKRVSMINCFSACSYKDQEAVSCVLGPLARSAEDIDLFMKSIIACKPWEIDSNLIPLPWKGLSDVDPKTLTIAIDWDDGVVKPTPPMIRGLELAKEKLEAAGVTVVDWKAIDVEKYVNACYSMYNADSNKAQKASLALSGEPVLKLSEVCLSFGCGDDGCSVDEYQKLAGTRNEGRIAYEAAMQANKIDFILSPTYCSVAAKPETIKYWGYTNLWNVLDFPNVIFPTGLSVDPSLDAPDISYVTRSEIEEYEYKLYNDAEEFKGAPINLQLTGKRWFDEDVVSASKIVAEIISA